MESIENIEFYIKELEIREVINPNCKTCVEIFYPQLRVGMKFERIFAPRHKASSRCESGKYPHCTCDTCF